MIDREEKHPRNLLGPNYVEYSWLHCIRNPNPEPIPFPFYVICLDPEIESKCPMSIDPSSWIKYMEVCYCVGFGMFWNEKAEEEHIILLRNRYPIDISTQTPVKGFPRKHFSKAHYAYIEGYPNDFPVILAKDRQYMGLGDYPRNRQMIPYGTFN